MSQRKRTWEALSFEVVMTFIALIALVVIVAPSLVVLIVSFTSGFSRDEILRPAKEDPRAEGGVFTRVAALLRELSEGATLR